ncbi:General stress protein 17o [Methylibium sp. T29]|nr:General stress protein 17o [Methylibium sp. T29]EWS59894.1 General stress protein 17o [Methylibium sp. T29-B]
MNKIENVLYRAQATATGGREGRAVSSDKVLDIQLSTPKELGGGGGPGTNPEQLFAAGYSACFLGAMKFVAGQKKQTLPADTTVTGKVGIGLIPQASASRSTWRSASPAWPRPTPRRWSRRRTACARIRTPRAATSRCG